MKKAFTLIELVTAVALMAMVLGFASVIFRVSIEAYRTAGANTEIMQKLRAVTDQLNADFKGQIWDPQGRVLFNYDDDNKVRSDSIVFFANGDFQSTKQYGGKTVVGNVACIFYGQADTSTNKPEERILVRRQTILSSDSTLPASGPLGEYYEASLAEWIVDPPIDPNDWINRPNLDPNDVNDLVMYMARGVDDFTIQYVGLDFDESGDLVEEFEFNEWRPENGDIKDEEYKWKNKSFAPLAFKFTFTLYDSKGIFENGRRFTHIVYLRD